MGQLGWLFGVVWDGGEQAYWEIFKAGMGTSGVAAGRSSRHAAVTVSAWLLRQVLLGMED